MRVGSRTLSTLAFALACAATVSPWQVASAQSGRMGATQSGTLYTSVEPALIQDMLEELGFSASVQNIGERGSREFVIMAEQDGFIFLVNLRACDIPDNPRGCLGINFFTTWDLRRGSARDAEEAAAAYNADQPFGKVTLDTAENAVYFTHYMIVDGGISRDNIAEYTTLFVAASSILAEEYMDGLLDQEGTGGSQGGKS